MSNVIPVAFGKEPENPDKLYNELEPIINELVETACRNLGEEEGCLLVRSISIALNKLSSMLDDQVEIVDEIQLTLEDGTQAQLDNEQERD